jgi:hypothetical protein
MAVPASPAEAGVRKASRRPADVRPEQASRAAKWRRSLVALKRKRLGGPHVIVHVTSRGAQRSGVTAVFRTAEERFEGLPDFGYKPNYRAVGDLRLAHLDVGEGAPVLMLHGEPAWSFIWRKVIPAVRDAGERVRRNRRTTLTNRVNIGIGTT